MQGFNKYYPPDYDPAQHTSLNSYHGKHALGDRARKLDKGILIVRFELPYNIWCGGCDNHLGQGVRYNAEKSKVGMYYTTPIWNFRCKCHLCSSWFEIRTDPQNTRYVVHSGARQKHEEWDPAESGGIVLDTPDPDAPPPDPFASLEKTTVQKTRALSAASHLSLLEEDRSFHWQDPYAASSLLRGRFRAAKKVRLESEGRAEGTRTRYALGDKVKVEDLRTPARSEDRESEEREWKLAMRERDKLASEQKEASNKDRERVGWATRGEPVDFNSKAKADAQARRSSSTRPVKPLPYRSHTAGTRSSSSKVAPATASTSTTVSTSPAVQSLASKLLLNTALKQDPFRTRASAATPSGTSHKSAGTSGSGSSRLHELEGKVRVKRRRVD